MESEDIPKQVINAELGFVQPEPDKQLPAMLLDTRPQDAAKMVGGPPGGLAEVREGPQEVEPQTTASELSPTSKKLELSPVMRQSSDLVGRLGQPLPQTSGELPSSS